MTDTQDRKVKGKSKGKPLTTRVYPKARKLLYVPIDSQGVSFIARSKKAPDTQAPLDLWSPPTATFIPFVNLTPYPNYATVVLEIEVNSLMHSYNLRGVKTIEGSTQVFYMPNLQGGVQEVLLPARPPRKHAH